MTQKGETVLFIINPAAGENSKGKIPSIIKKNIDTGRFDPAIIYSQGPGDATRIAAENLAKGIHKIIAVGGDGTVNEVAKALINTQATFGIIPLGSGNGLGRHLRLPLNTGRAVRVINRDRVAMMDYGTINQIPFFCTAGVGFDAYIGHMYSLLTKRGFANYAKVTLKEFFRYRPEIYTVRSNGHSLTKEAFLITVANASQFGNNAYIAPNADVSDGLLDVTILSPFPKYLSPWFGIKLFSRKLTNGRYIEMFRVKDFTIIRQEPGFVHYDGEPALMEEHLNFSIKPMGLNVFIP
ncbi:MAG TPA: diacylglycerol kinase family protein [Tenuifilaceae bacterium]|nr:diacylglycerol kinase family protein [Tenuifilaceae bacterium]